jgi:hypothetical protein
MWPWRDEEESVEMKNIVLLTYVPQSVKDILDVRENDGETAMIVAGGLWVDSKRAVLDIPCIF